MRFKKLRRGVLALCAAAAVTGLGQAHAAFPDRPINVVVPTAAGGTVDIVARIMAEKLGAELGQPVVVINKPGAGGVVGTQAFLREPQDGYTVLFTANSNQLIVPWVYKDAKFDPIKDFAPIAAVGEVPNVLCVNPAFPAKDMKEFMALIKANPEKYQYASAGAGTLNHLLGVMLDQMGGLRMQHIPYRGVSPAMADVMGNQVPMLFASLPSAVEGIKAGKLRALGVSSEKRNALLPDVPAINEAIPGFRGDLWVAFYGAKEAPRAAIDTLHLAIRKVLADQALQQKFDQLGVTMMHDGPAELAARQQAEYMQWKQVVQASGASPD
ncbi:Bug family tripartite tricarboxylate transporter substrate binding protein [Achromobacter aegrifaciens]|uniref:Tripartite tricarboxylate transporter substrate binding protein n=1 Tax=Achromobacter aegrifaciens TaxID=1287736 RepID=A0ABU2DGW9_ACHAE|nr:tripartite tricarboxylate transporter substrate binding protein [Achromobacter aegrifaciens]MDR7947348.1 tripartite tricarboxylate transporter substrate binding protein [Achromobacter aegrifaciens]